MWPHNFWHTIEHIFKTTWARDFKFGTRLCMGTAERAHKKFPLKVGVAWPRSRDPTIYWHTIEHICKTIWASDVRFGKRLWLTIAIWLSGSAYYSLLWGSTVSYPSNSLASCWQLSFSAHWHFQFIVLNQCTWFSQRCCSVTMLFLE